LDRYALVVLVEKELPAIELGVRHLRGGRRHLDPLPGADRHGVVELLGHAATVTRSAIFDSA
jgi:hypothetical protein